MVRFVAIAILMMFLLSVPATIADVLVGDVFYGVAFNPEVVDSVRVYLKWMDESKLYVKILFEESGKTYESICSKVGVLKDSKILTRAASNDFMLRWHHLVFFGKLFGKLGGVEVEYISDCIDNIHVNIIQILAYRFIEEDKLSVEELEWLEEFANVILEVQDSVHYYILGLNGEVYLGSEKIINGSLTEVSNYTPPTPDNAVRNLLS